jgi:hypothetical protein
MTKTLPFQPSTVPDYMKRQNKWVLWRLIERKRADGSPAMAKIPFQSSGTAASSTNAATWTTYEDAFDAYMTGEFDGMGFVLNGKDGIIGIDVDDCVRSDGSLSDLAQELLQHVNGYAEMSPSGTGIKLFTRGALHCAHVDNSKGLELYPDGRYFTVTGHVINGHNALPDTEQDVSWFVKKHFGEVGTQLVPLDALGYYKGPLEGWDLDRVRVEVLDHLSSDCGYAEWIKVGQALFHQFGGSHEAMELWDEWSQDGGSSTAYTPGLCETKWESFSSDRAKGRGPITLASLIKEAQEVAQRRKDDAFTKWSAAIEASTSFADLRDQVCKGVKGDSLIDHAQREALAALLKPKFKKLNFPMIIGDIKKLINREVQHVSADSPEWFKPWVFLNDSDRFFNIDSKGELTATGFCANFNRYVGGENAAQMAVNVLGIQTVARAVYNPTTEAGLFYEHNAPYANRYDPSTIPEIPNDLTPMDLDDLGFLNQHFYMLTGGSIREAELIKSWIAHNVKYPGKKIRWAPLLIGIQGDGKTSIAKMVASAMGGVNVQLNITKSLIESGFNGWAEGHCVGVFDDLDLSGEERAHLVEDIKGLIANDDCTIHRKGKDGYRVKNVTNYMGISNHMNAIPLESNDRRWFLVRTPFSKVSQLDEATCGQEQYFTRLADIIQNKPGVIRRWFLEMQFYHEFNADGRAPETSAKEEAKTLSDSDDMLTAKDVLEKGARGVTADLFSTGCMIQAIELENDGVVLRTRTAARLFQALGFAKLPWKVKWEGKAHIIWYSRKLGLADMDKAHANEAARQALDSSLGGAFASMLE